MKNKMLWHTRTAIASCVVRCKFPFFSCFLIVSSIFHNKERRDCPGSFNNSLLQEDIRYFNFLWEIMLCCFSDQSDIAMALNTPIPMSLMGRRQSGAWNNQIYPKLITKVQFNEMCIFSFCLSSRGTLSKPSQAPEIINPFFNTMKFCLNLYIAFITALHCRNILYFDFFRGCRLFSASQGIEVKSFTTHQTKL